jgi:nitrite reductase/ring-hydroxylating ferredoxin subunit
MWIKFEGKAPIEGTMKEAQLEGKEFLIGRNNGSFFCALNRCPHEDIKLTLGCIKNNRIKCSLHGYSFDIDTGHSSDANVENMQIFEIKQEDDDLFIKV